MNTRRELRSRDALLKNSHAPHTEKCINHSLARAIAWHDAGAVDVTWLSGVSAAVCLISEPELAHSVGAPAPDRASIL